MYNFQETIYESIDNAIIDQLVGLTEAEVYEIYDEYLDDSYGEIDCKFATYSASYLMKEIDPIMYQCGLAEYSSEVFRYIDGLYYNDDEASDIEDQCELVEDTTEKDQE